MNVKVYEKCFYSTFNLIEILIKFIGHNFEWRAQDTHYLFQQLILCDFVALSDIIILWEICESAAWHGETSDTPFQVDTESWHCSLQVLCEDTTWGSGVFSESHVRSCLSSTILIFIRNLESFISACSNWLFLNIELEVMLLILWNLMVIL